MKILLMLLSLALALAASPENQTLQADKGNGGHPVEIRIQSIINELNDFFSSKKSQGLFPEVDFDLYFEIAKEIQIRPSTERLYDKFGNERCLTNDRPYINIFVDCYKNFMSLEQERYATVFHEVLGMMDLEVAHVSHPSEYKISSRLTGHVGVNFKKSFFLESVEMNPIYTLMCEINGTKLRREHIYILVSFPEPGRTELAWTYSKLTNKGKRSLRFRQFFDDIGNVFRYHKRISGPDGKDIEYFHGHTSQTRESFIVNWNQRVIDIEIDSNAKFVLPIDAFYPMLVEQISEYSRWNESFESLDGEKCRMFTLHKSELESENDIEFKLENLKDEDFAKKYSSYFFYYNQGVTRKDIAYFLRNIGGLGGLE